MAPGTQQSLREPRALTVTPGALIAPSLPGATPEFVQEPFSVLPDTIRRVDQCATKAKLETEDRSWFDKPVKNEADTQAYFDNAVKGALNIPNGYEHVAVLVVRWDEALDDPMFKAGHDEEVERLQNVFGKQFHFDVSSEVRLKNTKKPQITLNKAIIDHMEQFDGRNNLLIVYYTGHGSLIKGPDGEDRLQLAAKNDSHRNTKGAWPATAIWSQAEKPLMESAEADVLTLLDCCYAGSAYKGTGAELRTYELLAACHRDDKTRAPGKNSFTTRLLNALESMLEDSRKPPIIMTRLAHIIDDHAAKGIPHISLLDRLDNHIGRHIQLAPVHQRAKEENKQFQLKPQEKAVVKIRFSLEDADLCQDQIEHWARELATLRHKTGVPIRRIDWIKVSKRQTSQRWKDAIDWVEMENKKRKTSSGRLSEDEESPVAKRQAREELLLPDETDVDPLTPTSNV